MYTCILGSSCSASLLTVAAAQELQCVEQLCAFPLPLWASLDSAVQEARGSSKCLAAIYFVSLAADDAAAASAAASAAVAVDADAVHRREHQQNVCKAAMCNSNTKLFDCEAFACEAYLSAACFLWLTLLSVIDIAQF